LNSNNLRSSIRFEISGVTIPGQVYENYTKTWEAVAKDLRNDEDFGGQISNSSIVKEATEQAIAGKTSIQEKADAILKYIQTNITWNQYYSKYTDKGVKNCLKEKTGNAGDINLLAVSMLKLAGIEAYPVVFSTLENGIINYSFPSSSKLNFVIASFIGEDKKTYLMDATSKISGINQLPKRCLNDRGIMIKDTGFAEIPLLNTVPSRILTTLNVSYENESFTGKYINQKTNYFSLEASEKYDSDKSEYEKEIKNEYSMELKDLTFKQENGNFKTEFNFNFNKDIETVGDKIIFNPLLFLNTEKQPFNAETRKYNIEFGTPITQINKVTITIPDTYILETPLKSKKVVLPDNLGNYSFNFSQNDNKISVTSTLMLNYAMYPADYYYMLKELWKNIIETESQLISLKKK